jgi:hypothetical protein
MKVNGLVPNTASLDQFIAPDSTASRPNPESKEDRPFTPNQGGPTSTLEATLDDEETEPC